MTMETFQEHFTGTLNSQQKQAVFSVDGRILLLAVPGSGKTTVLVTRLGYMVCCKNIDPKSILTMTFSVAAAREMKQRFGLMFGEKGQNSMDFFTINGLCYRIILFAGKVLGNRSPFDVIPDPQKSAVIRDIFQQVNGEYPTLNDITSISNSISYIKNMKLSEADIRASEFDIRNMDEIFTAYNVKLRKSRQMDYDDQLIYAYSILTKYPEILHHYQSLYRYICIDEAQDTSKLQHDIINLLTGNTGNLFMVGDEDQSIYGFRGSDPEALLNFHDKYPDAQILTLESNYRSDLPIVTAANQFIAKNPTRYNKTIRATKGNGKPVEIISLKYREQQYEYLFNELRFCTEDTAVLYRNNESALPLADLFERNGVPFQCSAKKELSFFTYQIVTDVENLIRFSSDPENRELFIQIYYKLGLPISREAADYACTHYRKGTGLLSTLASAPQISSRMQDKIRRTEKMISCFPNQIPSATLAQIWVDLDYKSFAEKRELDPWKFQVLKSLAKQVKTGPEFLQRLKELKEMLKRQTQNQNCHIFLSTVHASKGLEYSRVYLIDIIDGILPTIQQEDCTPEDWAVYEEERRICYVAITRAKKELCVMQYKDFPSSFVAEIFRDLHGDAPSDSPALMAGSGSRSLSRRASPVIPSAGTKVYHKKLGPGIIRSHSGDMVNIWIEQRGRVLKFLWSDLVKDQLLDF